QARLVDRKTVHLVQRDPMNVSFAHTEEVPEQRDAQHSRSRTRKPECQPLEERSAPDGGLCSGEGWLAGHNSYYQFFEVCIWLGVTSLFLQDASRATRLAISSSVSGWNCGLSGRAPA